MILEVGQARSWTRPNSSAEEQHKEPKLSRSFLDLPYEIRQIILQHSLCQKGTIEIQHPVWAGLRVFAQPLFRVSRLVRNEALQAFYETNDFLWIIDTEHKLRSNPTTYPAPTAFVHNGRYITPEIDPVLTPILPFQYPHLFKHLRHLQINVYLPQESDASALETQLDAMVKSLDGGRRLMTFHVLITAKRRAAQIPLTLEEQRALETLAQMKVRGCVNVTTRYYFRAVSLGVRAMNLDRRMKG